MCSTLSSSSLYFVYGTNFPQLDLSNIGKSPNVVASFFRQHCPQLEIIKWNFNNNTQDEQNYYFHADACLLLQGLVSSQQIACLNLAKNEVKKGMNGR